MNTSPNGTAVMHEYERCVLHAYPDPASRLGLALQSDGLWLRFLRGDVQIPPDLKDLSGAPWTIGWGDTGPGVVPGLVITQEEADARFARRLDREFEPGVLKLCTRTPTQAQFDALTCFAYNCGLANLAASTLLRKFNAGDIEGAANEFKRWDKAQGKVMRGLTRRRHTERALFLGASAAEAIAIGQAAA